MDQYILHRSWMYDRKRPGKRTLKAQFKEGIREFVAFTMSQDIFRSEGGIRCPCLKCTCRLIQSPKDVIKHLEDVGFMEDYYVWRHHGEQEPNEFDVNMQASSSGAHTQCENFGLMEDMVGDALGVNLSYNEGIEEEIIPNEKALKFYSMMKKVNEPLFEGSSQSKLSMCVRLLAGKSNWNVPEECAEYYTKMMRDSTPVPENLPLSYYEAKQLVMKLGLEEKKIDCCVNGCMLFYDNEFGKNDGALEECKFCNSPRYGVSGDDVDHKKKRVAVKSMFYLPIIPRLKRLFASMHTAGHMTWHYYNKTDSEVMRHPCDRVAWQHFDKVHPDFANDPRNVRLGLCSDGFTAYNTASARPYSCWPIIVTPYNLPPEMCMTKPYMFLSCIVPGPLYTHSPRHTTTPISARSPASSPSIHGVTMSGVNPPLYTQSLRHTTTPISARPPTPSPSINGVSFPRGTVSSVTPPLHTHSPGYNNTHFSARPPTLSSDLLPDVRFLELLGINGGFMPVPEVQQEQEHEQEQEQQQEQQQHCEQEHQSQQEREAAQQRRVRRRYYEVVPKYKSHYILEIKGDSLEPSKISSKYIREAIQAVYKKPWPVYKDLKKEIGDKVFKEFKRHCVWDPQYESDVERIFHRLASSRLSDMLYDERKNIAEDRSYRPHWMAEDHWRALLSYWATNDIYKKRSTANKRNRASSRQARHTQGSVTTATHARHMAKDLGRDP
ncbi:uncharacterized protein [Medicago truncatula]|uniref:uncharacterized protein n=1 Tax=Medicago truncatula TaxID=3880 RepID=UPI000D2F21A1|nr:uncharacterized protein LOC112420129 [Medicago truncatula]